MRYPNLAFHGVELVRRIQHTASLYVRLGNPGTKIHRSPPPQSCCFRIVPGLGANRRLRGMPTALFSKRSLPSPPKTGPKGTSAPECPSEAAFETDRKDILLSVGQKVARLD